MPVSRRDRLMEFLGTGMQQGAQGYRDLASDRRQAQSAQDLQEQRSKLEAADRVKKIEEARTLQNQYPKSSVNIEGVSINPESENLMSLLNLQERQDARDDRDLVKFGERVQNAGIPNTMSALANLERGTAGQDAKGGILRNPNYEIKSAGPVANFLPQWVKNAGEKVGLMPKGASEESALIQRLVNADIRNLSGTAVTAYEQGRQNVEKGMTGGGDPALVKVGLKQMQDALNSASQNIVSSTRPEVVRKYRAQDGRLSLDEFLGAGPQQPETPEQKYQRLKQKFGR